MMWPADKEKSEQKKLLAFASTICGLSRFDF